MLYLTTHTRIHVKYAINTDITKFLLGECTTVILIVGHKILCGTIVSFKAARINARRDIRCAPSASLHSCIYLSLSFLLCQKYRRQKTTQGLEMSAGFLLASNISRYLYLASRESPRGRFNLFFLLQPPIRQQQ